MVGRGGGQGVEGSEEGNMVRRERVYGKLEYRGERA